MIATCFPQSWRLVTRTLLAVELCSKKISGIFLAYAPFMFAFVTMVIIFRGELK
jgi:hypothetical protein